MHFVPYLHEQILSAWPVSVVVLLIALIGAGIMLAWVAVVALVAVWAERKVSAHMQARLGPMYVGGFHGWLQTAADGLKLFLKEDIIPAMADKWLFIQAPVLVFGGALLAYAAIPFGPKLVVSDINIGVFYILAVSAIVAIGIIMAGWASHNKWSLYGGMRTAAQFLSYEIPSALHLMPVIMYAGTLNLGEIVQSQETGLFGWGGIFGWYAFRNPFLFLSFICYYISSLAETNRTPFDLPETESELVAGFHTEYTGIRFSFFFMAEYADMFVVAALSTLLFCGGWNCVLPRSVQFVPDPVVFVLKCSAFIFLTMWLRWTLPRFRVDQLMALCWKFLIPLGLLNIVGSGLWMYIFGQVK
ncbi:MAG TPA: NADH-quinone oxidoreductase subunit NuoH [bacterium]|nr:NADH-quinone oxidoreductase subunit NuoH [bacterium]HPO08232.1 NADH-quinone oxidoreductase subunit NuoH [bacterium]HQO34004.1 NADH-quinone oxidoreductase subunit NuoH [bacterium]HQP97101.1 NADH-quinone oxidoreductase subunit NuoH [bacterium]